MNEAEIERKLNLLMFIEESSNRYDDSYLTFYQCDEDHSRFVFRDKLAFPELSELGALTRREINELLGDAHNCFVFLKIFYDD